MFGYWRKSTIFAALAMKRSMKAFYTTIVLLFVTTLCGQAQTGIRYLNKQAGLTNNQVTTLEQDHHGYIWAGTANGLNRIDGHEVFTWDSPKHPLYNLPVRAIEADKEGNCLWVFTPAGLAGCFLFDTNQLLPYIPEKADSLFRYHHKGRLYMWQYGPGKRCNRIRLNKGKLDVRTFPHEVLDICTDEDGGDWLMTKEGIYLNGFEEKLPASDSVTRMTTYRNLCLALTPREVIIYNHSRRIARRTPFPAGYRSASQCMDLAAWGDQLLIFTPERTISYHILDGVFTAPSNIQLRGGQVLPESGATIYAYDGRGKLLRLGNDGTVYTLQLMPQEVARQLNGQLPQVVTLDATTEAFSTYGNGLHLLDLKSGKSTHHRSQGNTKDLIRDNRIGTLLADHTGCLWVATHQMGLACLQFSSQAEGTDSVASPSLQTHITFVTVDGESRLIDTDEMELSYTHNNVEWHFSCLDYAQVNAVRYQYRLAGHDSTWQGGTHTNKVLYKNLPSGRHSFHVRASLDGVHWGAESTHVVIIGEPWWSQWPAMLSMLVLFLAIGLFLYLIVHRFIHPEQVGGDEPLHSLLPSAEQEGATPQEVLTSIQSQQGASEQASVESSGTAQEEAESKESENHPQLTAKDERFRQLLEALMEEHIEDPEFNVEEFAACANLKRTQFYTKVKRVTGLSPIELLRKAHLQHAARLLLDTDLNIDEVRERCGFTNSTTFYSYFKQQYGMTPRQYRQQK